MKELFDFLTKHNGRLTVEKVPDGVKYIFEVPIPPTSPTVAFSTNETAYSSFLHCEPEMSDETFLQVYLRPVFYNLERLLANDKASTAGEPSK